MSHNEYTLLGFLIIAAFSLVFALLIYMPNKKNMNQLISLIIPHKGDILFIKANGSKEWMLPTIQVIEGENPYVMLHHYVTDLLGNDDISSIQRIGFEGETEIFVICKLAPEVNSLDIDHVFLAPFLATITLDINKTSLLIIENHLQTIKTWIAE
jgi:hypothetical protein